MVDEGHRREHDKLDTRLEKIEKAIWAIGDPEGVGLLEKTRGLKKVGLFVWTAGLFLLAFLGRLIWPIYDNFVSQKVRYSLEQHEQKGQKQIPLKAKRVKQDGDIRPRGKEEAPN